jgi:hypothetical protein
MISAKVSRCVLALISVSTLAFSQLYKDPNNMIKNGGFEEGATSWVVQGVHGSGCTGKVVNGEMVCVPVPSTAVAANDTPYVPRFSQLYDCQLLQENLNIVKGVTYVITYDIKADVNRQVQSAVELQVKPHDQFACKKDPNPLDNPQQNVTTTMQTLTREFTMVDDTKNNIRLCFSFGAVISTVTFDNICFFDKSKMPTAIGPQSFTLVKPEASRMIETDSRGISFRISDPAHFQFRICSPAGRLVAGSNSVNSGSASRYRIEFPSLGISSGTYIVQAVDGKERYSRVLSVMP